MAEAARSQEYRPQIVKNVSSEPSAPLDVFLPKARDKPIRTPVQHSSIPHAEIYYRTREMRKNLCRMLRKLILILILLQLCVIRLQDSRARSSHPRE